MLRSSSMRARWASCTTMVVIGVCMTAGPGDLVAGPNFGEIVDICRRHAVAGVDEDFATAGQGVAGVRPFERQGFDVRPLQPAAGAEPEQGHLDPGLAIGRSLAVFAFVQRLEIVDQPLERRRVHRRRAIDGRSHLMHLASVAQVDGPIEGGVRFGKALGGKLRLRLLDHRRIERVDRRRVGIPRQGGRDRIFVDNIRRDQAEGAVHRRGIGHDNALHIQLGGEAGGQDRTGAAEGVQHIIPRVEAALDGDLVDQVGHLRRGDPEDAEGGLFHRHAQPAGDLRLEGGARRRDVQRHRAAEENVRVHIADQRKDVGERHLRAAAAVADRARIGAGAARADARNVRARVERNNAAAGGADRHHLDLGRDIVIPVDHRLAGIFDLAVLDDADLEGRAAHVGGDHVGVAHQVTQRLGPDHAGGWAALDHADGAVGGFLGRQQPAIALHDHDRPAIAAAGELRLQVGQITAGNAAGIGVDDRRRAALVFARDRRDFARQGDIGFGRDPPDDVARLPFVLGIVEGPEEGDSDRLDLPVADQVAHRLFGPGFVERQQHRALVVDALGHAAHRIFRNQRRRPVARHRMLDPVLRLAGPAAVGAARDEDRVLEAAGRNQPGRRAAAGQQRVVDHGRAVHEEVGPGEQLLDAQVHLLRRDSDRIEHTAGKVRRRRQGLAHDEGLAGGDNDGIGTGAADIGRHDKAFFAGICVHETVSVFRRWRRMPDSILHAWKVPRRAAGRAPSACRTEAPA